MNQPHARTLAGLTSAFGQELYFSWFDASNGRVFFNAASSAHGAEAWRTDGTAAGTTNLGVLAAELTCSRNTLFFRGYDPGAGYELWASDGTGSVTQRVVDIQANGSGFPTKMIDVGSGICFVAESRVAGELWFSNGTAVTIDTQFAASFTVPIAIPNAASLEGVVFHFQTVWVDPSAAPTVQVSNGLQLTLGTDQPH